MKKTSIIILAFLLMISCITIYSFATENTTKQENVETTEVNAETEEVQQPGLEERNETIINTVGKVISTKEIKEVQKGSMKDKVQEVTIEITEGDYIDEEFSAEYILSYDIEGKIVAYELDVGDKVSVQLVEDENGNITASVLDVVRTKYILGIFILFLASIILIGGKKGVKAVLGLLLTVVLIYFVMIRNIYAGKDAILYSILTAVLVIIGTFIIIGGLNKKILTAALGTVGGVVSAGIVALIFNNLAKLTGAGEEALQLSANMQSLSFNFRDLLFAGIIVSALGACMDVGMSIASSLDEIKMKNPDITWKELLKSGMNIGRDVIGTMTNTLILAYVGGSLTLILLFIACNMNFIEIINKEMIAEQIISAISASMGVIYTVPMTSLVYALLNKDKVIYRRVAENKVDGKRSLKI